jgi:hypothetical protein
VRGEEKSIISEFDPETSSHQFPQYHRRLSQMVVRVLSRKVEAPPKSLFGSFRSIMYIVVHSIFLLHDASGTNALTLEDRSSRHVKP